MVGKPNILFIIVDALRPRNMGCYGYSKPTSPNIDKLAKNGVLFENAYSCAITTYPSLASIFSGKYPLSHGIIKLEPTRSVYKNIKRLNESGTFFLPEILKLNGYTTLAVDWLGRWNKRGYDYYSGVMGGKRLQLYSLIKKLTVESIKTRLMLKIQNLLQQYKMDAKSVTDKAIDLIKKHRDKRFFLFIHYWDTHVPYKPPKDYTKQFIKYNYGRNQSIEETLNPLRPKHSWYVQKYIMRGTKTINVVLARYDATIAYVDHEVGRLIKTLGEYGILENTFIVLTSDHGESLTEHGIYFTHHGLYDVTVHVPLILKYHEFPEGKRIKGLVQHVDITPTLLNILSIKDRTFYLDGKSTVPLIYGELDQFRGEVFFQEADWEKKMAVRTMDYKYIHAQSLEDAMCKQCDRIHGGVEELYDLKKDPDETNNIIKENPEKTRVLKGKLFGWVGYLRSKRARTRTMRANSHSLEEEEQLITERLKQLGYL